MLIDFILNNISEEYLFYHYTSIKLKDINLCILNKSYLVRNPLRKTDIKPSVGFQKYNKKNCTLYMHDFGNSAYNGDIINLVGILKNLNCNTKKGFIKLCEIIIKETIYNKEVLNNFKGVNIPIIKPSNTKLLKQEKKLKVITPELLAWNNNNFKYWYDHVKPNKKLALILLETLIKYSVFPVNQYWIGNNKKSYDKYTPANPIYSYYQGRDVNGIALFKLYAPNSIDKKFTTNNSSMFNYMVENDVNDILFIAKANKDFILLSSSHTYWGFDKISMVTVSSEIRIPKLLYNTIKYNYVKIIQLYDFDETGILNGFYNNAMYNIKCLYIVGEQINVEKIVNSKLANFILAALRKELINATKDDIRNFIKYYKIRKYFKYIKDYPDLMKSNYKLALKIYKNLYENE